MTQVPNLNALRSFDAAARHLNFRLAAAELMVTQGAVAQQIRRLESDLGVALFHREPRGVSLTAAGSRLQPMVRRAMELLQQGLAQLQDSATVTLSVPPSFATKFLLPRLPALATQHPELTLNIRAEERRVDLQAGLADLAVRLGPEPQDPGLGSALLAPVRLIAVARPGLCGTRRQLQDFQADSLIQDGHRFWESLMLTAGLRPSRPMLQLNQTGLALDAALQGQGVALVPDIYLTDPLAEGRLQALWQVPQSPPQGFYLLWSRGHERAEMRKLRDWLQGAAQTNVIANN